MSQKAMAETSILLGTFEDKLKYANIFSAEQINEILVIWNGPEELEIRDRSGVSFFQVVEAVCQNPNISYHHFQKFFFYILNEYQPSRFKFKKLFKLMDNPIATNQEKEIFLQQFFEKGQALNLSFLNQIIEFNKKHKVVLDLFEVWLRSIYPLKSQLGKETFWELTYYFPDALGQFKFSKDMENRNFDRILAEFNTLVETASDDFFLANMQMFSKKKPSPMNPDNYERYKIIIEIFKNQIKKRNLPKVAYLFL